MPWFSKTSLNGKKHYQWLLGFICLVVRQYQAKECQKSAASLTYVTLFATVPLMTVTYSMFSVIPPFQNLGDQLQATLFEHFLPNSEHDLRPYLREFSAQARQLTAAGLAFLAVSAYLMLKNIETNFNAIWGVARGRRGVANFLLYWAVLSLGPLLLGAALAMSTYLASFRLLVGPYDSLGLVETVLQFAPWLLTWAAFTLLFAVVPNCKVPVLHALIGGFFTTAFFQGLKAVFSWIVSHSSFTLVYGAFAAVPLFLLWVNLIWTVILGGAVFVHTINAYQIGLRDRNYPDLLASLLVLWRCYLESKEGRSVPERMLLQEGLAADQWLRVSEALVKNRVLTTNFQGNYLLCHDLKTLRLIDLMRILGIPSLLPLALDSLNDLPWAEQATAELGAVDAYMRDRLQRSVASIFDRVTDTDLSSQTP